MPERQRGRKPPERKEDTLYSKAVRYPDEQSSESPYDNVQELIRVEPCNLSVYRIRLGDHLEYHVAVLGEPPAQELQRRIDDFLKDGEAVTLPSEAVDALLARRAQQQKDGPWVEHRHFPRRRL
jgi:hypothetical protein